MYLQRDIVQVVVLDLAAAFHLAQAPPAAPQPL